MKGATGMYKFVSETSQYFNPRTHEGCDYDEDLDHCGFADISIHAPMKGATVDSGQLTKYLIKFQSTHP